MNSYCDMPGCTFVAIAGGECERHYTLRMARIEEMQQAARAAQERDPIPPADPIVVGADDDAPRAETKIFRSHSWSGWKQERLQRSISA